MQKIGIGMVALAMVLAYAPAPVTAAESTSIAPSFDTSRMTPIVVPIPFDGEYTISVNHVTGDITVLAGNQASGIAGCLHLGLGGNFATNPVSASLTGCAFNLLTTGIESSQVVCTTFSFCGVLAVNLNFLNFGLAEIFCVPFGAASQSWIGGLSAGTSTCFVAVFGPSPAVFDLWEGFVTGSGPVTLGTHVLL